SAKYSGSVVAFSPDGKLLATGGGDNMVRLWNPATGNHVAILHASGGKYGAHGVAFSRDGKLLASGGGDGTVRLWQPATGQPVGAPIQTGAQNVIFVVVFSHGGKLLASGGLDGDVRVWQASIFTHTYAALCADAGPPTRQEWNDYAPGETQPKACG